LGKCNVSLLSPFAFACYCYISLTQYEHSHIQAGFSGNQMREKDLLNKSEEEQANGASKGTQVNT